MTTLLKHSSVLHKMSTNGPRVRFSQEADEPGDIMDTIYISRDDWLEMGSPETITITVEPGDKLNASDPRSRPEREVS